MSFIPGYYTYEEIKTISLRVPGQKSSKLHDLLGDFIFVPMLNMYLYQGNKTKTTITYKTDSKISTFQNSYYRSIGIFGEEDLKIFSDLIIRLNVVKKIDPNFHFEIYKYTSGAMRYATPYEIAMNQSKKTKKDENIFITNLISELTKSKY